MRNTLHRITGLRRRRNVLTSITLNPSMCMLISQQKGEHPLLSRNSRNIFHEQALAHFASAYESLKLGDSRDAQDKVYDLGQRIFGREKFEAAVRDTRLHGSTA
jgi:hypothetical protein